MTDNPTIVFPAANQVVIENHPRPSPGPGQLLLKTRCTLISTGTELTLLGGAHEPGSAWAQGGGFPVTPGYNNISEVVAAGEGVPPTWIGKRVACYNGHTLWHVRHAVAVHPIPDGVDDAHAAFFTIAEIVMNGVRRGQVTWGESAVVFGLGLLGQLAVRILHLAGARPVIGVDVVPGRIGKLPSTDGIVGIDGRTADVPSEVARLTRGRKADCAFELTGNAGLIPSEFKALRNQGRFVVLSSPHGKTIFDFHDLCNAPSFTIIGAHNSSHPRAESPQAPWTRARHVEIFFDALAVGALDMGPLISHRRPFHEAPGLYELLGKDGSQAMGVILDWRA